jgi:hypothetical protein
MTKEKKETQPVVYTTPMTSTVVNGIKVGDDVVKSLSTAGTADKTISFVSSDESVNIAPTANAGEINFTSGPSASGPTRSLRHTRSLKSFIDEGILFWSFDDPHPPVSPSAPPNPNILGVVNRENIWSGYTYGPDPEAGWHHDIIYTQAVNIPLNCDNVNHTLMRYLTFRCPTLDEIASFIDYTELDSGHHEKNSPNFAFMFRMTFAYQEWDTVDVNFIAHGDYLFRLHVSKDANDPEHPDGTHLRFTYRDLTLVTPDDRRGTVNVEVDSGQTIWINTGIYPPNYIPNPCMRFIETKRHDYQGHHFPRWIFFNLMGSIFSNALVVTDINPTKWMTTFTEVI